jgi:MinD superfamily P-loop ATPase
MEIAVASGKGGTGKSFVAANLGYAISQERETVLVDCDVEEPNLHLFFPGTPVSVPVTTKLPAIDEDRCTLCGDCASFCRYGALTVTKSEVLFLKNLCHSCGGCEIVCRTGAISEEESVIGRVDTLRIPPHLTLVSGILNVGEVKAPTVIKAAREAAAGSPLVIYDAAPGVTCPVVETLLGCDACILVTEPTPFGLHDLDLAVQLTTLLGVPSGVVVNRSTPGADEALRFCERYELPVLLDIPFDREIARIHNRGGLLSQSDSAWADTFRDLFHRAEALSEGGL